MLTIPIILSSDNEYASFMYITMLSILKNSSEDSFYDFYLMVPSAFSYDNKKSILNLKKMYNCEISFIDMKNIFSDQKMMISHISFPTYYRLLAADLLPQKYDKCIYLDVDVCVCKDLSELYNIDMKDNYVAGVVAATYFFQEEYNCKRLNLPSMKTYINAGVLLMNLKKIRADNLTKLFIKLSKNDYLSQDQDVINVACYGHIMILQLKYNVMTKYKGLFDTSLEQYEKLVGIYGEDLIKEAVKSPVIIHYADKIKPWHNPNSLFADYFWKYARISDCYEKIFFQSLKSKDLKEKKFYIFKRVLLWKIKYKNSRTCVHYLFGKVKILKEIIDEK